MANAVDALVEQAEAEWFELFTAGPEDARRTELPPQIGNPAPDLELPGQTGDPVRLSEVWSDDPTLVIFRRHFGCRWDRAADRLAREYEQYREAGADVVIVAEGQPTPARGYADERDIPCPFLRDPDREAPPAHGLREFVPAEVLHGASAVLLELGPDAAAEIAADRRADDRPLVDNPWQQPGEFVVAPDGMLRLTCRYQYCEDYPDPAVLGTAIDRAKT